MVWLADLYLNMSIPKEHLGLAGEYAVATELCKRGIYAQLTLGHRKRTDLLIFHEGRYTRVEVKAKQGSIWPNCRGIQDDDSFLVFVDFAGTSVDERPSFYILSLADWIALMRRAMRDYRKKHPDRRIELKDGCLIFLDEVSKHGQPYHGCGVKPSEILDHLEKWDKIAERISPT